MKYLENEIKVLDIDVENSMKILKRIGALKVYDDFRVITGYDTQDRSLFSKGIQLKITEEGAVKMSLDQVNENGKVISIKNKLGRKVEMEDTLMILGYAPVTVVKARRVSFELEGNDFDIDVFPNIPPFLEIDCKKSSSLGGMLKTLGLINNDKVTYSTIKIFEKYGINYYDVFKI